MQALVEWDPDAPTSLSPDELAQYRRGRNAALAEISNELGVNCAVLDL